MTGQFACDIIDMFARHRGHNVSPVQLAGDVLDFSIELQIALRDKLSGDPDLEDDSEDCCEAGDDGTIPGEIREGAYARIGDCDDDEDDDAGGDNAEDDFCPTGVQAWPSGPGCIIGDPDFGADGS